MPLNQNHLTLRATVTWVRQSDRILVCLLGLKLPADFHKCPLKQMKQGMLAPDTFKAAGIGWMSLLGQRISCKELNGVAIEVQIIALGLLSRGDEQRKFTSPLIPLSPEAGCRWELKALFPFPPQRLSLLSLKLEGNPRGDPNPWNSSSCAFLLSQIINYHALYIHCTSNSKNSTKLPPAGYIFPRNMNVLAVGWVAGEPNIRVLCWEWNRPREDNTERMFPGSATTQLQEWGSPQLRKSLPSAKAPTNVWWEVCSSQGFQDFPESQSDGISSIYLLVASLSCTLFTNLYSCNILPLQTSKIFLRFSEKVTGILKTYQNKIS